MRKQTQRLPKPIRGMMRRPPQEQKQNRLQRLKNRRKQQIARAHRRPLQIPSQTPSQILC